ncbi:SDR family oxidoreductase [Marinimicrobium sp. ABcell2]|uniref:SDR family oxidoreductase n=1 Tax=Marinimicrobium sp. ABcell2 TaxID=3069751 RepID=UPI0027AF1140|nr:SDR family oxidoreductase [Marinimicrobium sp. ABcell2]MDQ2077197.1 SDR family oxidoreductase [Marinimicrobium sp. ABcell2]
MKKSNKSRDLVVVITGASSGIGRATAHAFAREGATLVLAARREEALRETLHECEELGGRGIVVPTDVGDSEQVDRLADAAVEAYDRLDVWVNNAAVSLFGRLEETPREDYEHVLRTNLLGIVNGARAAIRQFREQGKGRLINVSSMVGHSGQPYVSAYVTSKWAIRGLTESLRMELSDAPNISATVISPASIDTPIFQHAGNYTGRPIKAMKPVYPPEQVAAAIVRAAHARSPRREIIVGNAGRMMAMVRTLIPPLGERMMRQQVETDHFAEGPPVDLGSGTVNEPASGKGSVRGGWIEREHGNSSGAKPALYSALALSGVALTALVGRRVMTRNDHSTFDPLERR